jgi:hypothetical protein
VGFSSKILNDRWRINKVSKPESTGGITMRLKTHPAGVIVGIIFLFCAVCAAQEQWLGYRYHREARRIMPYSGGRGEEASHDKPADVKLPELESESPVFYKWETPMAKSGSIWMALDNSHTYGPHNKLYIDSNCNGHLDDEEAIEAYQVDQYYGHFGPVRIIFDTDEGPITYHLNVEHYAYRDSDSEYIYIYPGCWYEGQIIVDGEKKKCALMDSNLNGTFNDKGMDDHDRIQIGENGGQDPVFVGNYIEVDDKLYHLEVAKDGAFVVLKNADDVMYGSFAVPETISEFAAGGENGLFWVSLEKGKGKLPEGEYKVYRWAIERKDDKGDNWKIDARAYGRGSTIEISQEKEAAIDIGEPLISTFTQRESGGRYSFSQGLEGRNGENINLTKNNSQPKAPTLHIESKDGSYSGDFTFEYG